MNFNYALSLEWWELHEAAFNLTTWPKEIAYSAVPSPIDEQIKRGVIRVPNERLNKETLNCDTKLILRELKKSIKKGDLPVRSYKLPLKEFYGNDLSYFLSPIKVIIWALLKGFILPKELQKKLGIILRHEKTVGKYGQTKYIFELNQDFE